MCIFLTDNISEIVTTSLHNLATILKQIWSKRLQVTLKKVQEKWKNQRKRILLIEIKQKRNNYKKNCKKLKNSSRN